MIFAYFGPDTLLPVTSIIAAAAGAILMFGRLIWHTLARVFRTVTGKGEATVAPATIRRSAASMRLDTGHEAPAPSHLHQGELETAEVLEEAGA